MSLCWQEKHDGSCLTNEALISFTGRLRVCDRLAVVVVGSRCAVRASALEVGGTPPGKANSSRRVGRHYGRVGLFSVGADGSVASVIPQGTSEVILNTYMALWSFQNTFTDLIPFVPDSN